MNEHKLVAQGCKQSVYQKFASSLSIKSLQMSIWTYCNDFIKSV